MNDPVFEIKNDEDNEEKNNVVESINMTSKFKQKREISNDSPDNNINSDRKRHRTRLNINNCSNTWFSGYAPDSGFSWIALIAGFITFVLYTFTGPMFGILFTHKVKGLLMSSLNITLTFNGLSFVWNVASTMAGPLCEEFGWRKVGICGAFFCSLSIFLTDYVTSKIGIIFSFSLLSGFGGGLSFSTALFLVSNYFVHKRGLAMAILGSGIGTGHLTLPLFIRYLQETYGYNGAALIYSSFLLHGVVAATFFHPLERHTQKYTERKRPYLKENYLKEVMIECDKKDRNADKRNFCLNSCEIAFQKIASISKNLLKLSGNNILNLKSPVVSIIALSCGCMVFSFLNIMLMAPLYFVAKGLTLQDAAYSFSMAGIWGIISRAIIPALSDYKVISNTTSYIAGLLLIAIPCLVITFTSHFPSLVICFAIIGAGFGTAMGVFPLLLIDYKGLKEMPQTYGSYGFISAMLFLIVGPTIGIIRDITGSYILMYRIIFGMLIFGTFIWIVMPFAIRYDKEQHNVDIDMQETNKEAAECDESLQNVFSTVID